MFYDDSLTFLVLCIKFQTLSDRVKEVLLYFLVTSFNEFATFPDKHVALISAVFLYSEKHAFKPLLP